MKNFTLKELKELSDCYAFMVFVKSLDVACTLNSNDCTVDIDIEDLNKKLQNGYNKPKK